MHRRNFFKSTVSCGAHVAALAMFSPAMTRQIFAHQSDDKIVEKEKWGYVEAVDENIWAMISTPFDSRDFTTVCNSGIIAGKDRVLVVDAFMQPAGAEWISNIAKKLTGRRPTDVVCTHYHADHTSGHAGFEFEKQHPNIWLTESTIKSATESLKAQEKESNFKNVRTLPSDKPTKIDLGGRVVTVRPRSGHTSSDVTIEITEPKIVWCGDLFFNRMFPNYSDAQPKLLNQFAVSMVSSEDTTFVPGHGPIADPKAVLAYQNFLKHVEKSATAAFKSEQKIDEAVKDFKLPESLKDWFVWSPDVVKRSYTAWYRTLKSDLNSKQNLPINRKL